ncbi:MAG: FtsX-like permease family protein [Bacteriovoracaceae bacterium]|nr:FtsX-like permease family protein [Bacteriovoracaceae bacterium]
MMIMFKLFSLLSFRQYLTHPVRHLLTIFSVSLGVALFFGIKLVNQSTVDSFRNNITSLTGKSDLTITGDTTGMDEALIDQLSGMPHFEAVVPMSINYAYTSTKNKNESILILGVDLLKESTLRAYEAKQTDIIEDPLVFLNQPDSIVVTEKMAAQYQLALDSKLELLTSIGPKFFTVRGMLQETGPMKAFGGLVALMDIDGARQTFGRGNHVDRIDLLLKNAKQTQEVKSLLISALPHNLRIETIEDQVSSSQDLIRSIQVMTSAMSFLSLLVGMFIIYNMVSISVFQRTQQLGMMRALGQSKRSLFFLILLENGILGFFSALLGLGLALLLARQLIPYFGNTISVQLFIPIHIDSISLSAFDWVMGPLCGVIISIIAAYVPARRATRISPSTALKPNVIQYDSPSKESSKWGLMAQIGAWIFLISHGPKFFDHYFTWYKIPEIQPIFLLLGMASVIMMSPWCVLKLISFIPRTLTEKFLFLRLAKDQLLRFPNQTASNSLNLIVGLVLVMAISTMLISFKTTILTWTKGLTPVESILVSSQGSVISLQVQPLSENFKSELVKLPHLSKNHDSPVIGVRIVHTQYQKQQVVLKSYDDPGRLNKYSFLDVRGGGDNVETGKKLFNGVEKTVAVSESFSLWFHKDVGDMIELYGSKGTPHQFKIIGIVRDFGGAKGVLYMDRRWYRDIWDDHNVTTFSLTHDKSITNDDFRKMVESTIGVKYKMTTTSGKDFNDQMETILNSSFTVSEAVEWISLFVGLLGLLNSLLISTLQRKKELGLWRALGMERSQLVFTLLMESFLLAFASLLVAISMGSVFSYLLLTKNINYYIGWVIDFYLPPASILVLVFVGLALTLLTALGPAIYCARQKLRDGLAYE